MKLLKIDAGQGYFCSIQHGFTAIDKITKEDLLQLAGLTLESADVEFDEYNANDLKNHAHQIIYKSVFEKLRDLGGRRKEFKDESGRLYLTEYEKYRNNPMPLAKAAGG